MGGPLYILGAMPFLTTHINNSALTGIFLGLGTIMLHMTQRFYGQICDELSMLCLCYLILNKINKNKYPKKILLFNILLYIQNHKNYIYFICIFTIQILLIIYESKNIKNNKKIFKRNVFLMSMIIGTILWILDQKFCKYVNKYQLHAFWHIFTSIGLLSGLSLLNDQ